jgi:hypothetical protein
MNAMTTTDAFRAMRGNMASASRMPSCLMPAAMVLANAAAMPAMR